MNHVFDIDSTRKKQILVEYITDTGSGFAVTPQGEQVFMNKRLVDAVGVQSGDIYDAFLLPNYPDKQAQIPWRAMRVEKAKTKLDLGHVSVDSDLQNIMEYMKTFEEGAHFTVPELCDALDMPFDVVEGVMEKHKDVFFQQDSYCLHIGHN